jgi:ligand-binding sensor domain-containing protein
MQMQRLYLIFLLFLIIGQHGFAQNHEGILFDRILSENIKLEKGLSQNTVYSLIQDQDGFMWFGTWDGLNKYDGNKFVIYDKVNGLTHESIYALLQASDGKIWIGTEDGLNNFDPKNGRIANYTYCPGDSNCISNDLINKIYEDRLGNIWVATANGLNQFVPESDSFIKMLNTKRDNAAVRSSWINDIFQDEEGFYWIATRYGLIRYDADTKIISRFYHNSEDENSLCCNWVTSLCKDKKGNLWVGTQNGLSKMDSFTKRFVNYFNQAQNPSSLSANIITQIIEDREGNVWIGTDGGGLNLYDKACDCFIQFEHSPNESSSLGNNKVYSIFEDNIGNLWIGTFMGVSKIDKHSGKFKVYRHDPESGNTISNNFVRDFLEVSPGTIWIATEGGVNIYNEKTNEFSFLKMEAGNSNGKTTNLIRDIMMDSKGDFWLATSDVGVIKIDAKTSQITNFVNDPNDTTSIGGNFVQFLFEDRDNAIWVSTVNGLSRLDQTTGEFKNFRVLQNDLETYRFDKIYDILQDSTGLIWFASQHGLTQYHPDQDSFSSVLIRPEHPGQIVSNKLFSIYNDKGVFWLSTRGGGLVRYDRAEDEFKIYTQDDGLPSNMVYGLIEDEDGKFWLSTNWGLSKFDPQTGHTVNYDAQDGLQSNEFNGNAILKSASGKFYFGGMNGFNSFYPNEIQTNPHIPRIKITGLKVFNSEMPYEVFIKDTVFLKHDDNFFSFEFSALDYTNPGKNKYRYILEGVDEEWRETGANNPTAEYTKVAPGIYVFRVIGSNNDGFWNKTGAKIVVAIRPPWWKSMGFRAPMVLITVLLIFLVTRARFNTLRRKHESEKKVLEIERHMFDVEQKALQLQMNPHFIFNSLNSIQSFVIKNDTDKAINYLAKFSQLMRLILSNSRESYIPLKDELTYLQHYLDIERLRFDDKFDYKIVLDPRIDEDFVEIPPMLFQPYVENAIVHGLIHSPKEGFVSIEFKLVGNKIHCTIEDNGIGRDKSELIKMQTGLNRKSRGLLITQERLDLLSKQQDDQFSVKIIDLKDEHGNALGTRVELIVLFVES